MSAPVVLSADEYTVLVQKARAWDDHIKRRFNEGFARADTHVRLAAVNSIGAAIELSDQVIITPFGKATVHMEVEGKRVITMNIGDSVILNHEVNLKIS